ncbi:uncharacterized protein ANIA_11647 [Aspergillus nidulans FGSC A4]|uniref:Uncharacterized protein n=1 Tax=Emericella nidulans (strain FGSC A4 / ATCC 38163 / CBS 112.46 / NRRL 194 / M139) TaxID=227321 RepID=C8VQ95_EMENI|nr:hypothetical protein [Aspergillus nidulans FGSC A4]CBF87262.1 TPA: hypothetical protein ANIA_11647 [Aspergillus nidulans FGSC A4]
MPSVLQALGTRGPGHVPHHCARFGVGRGQEDLIQTRQREAVQDIVLLSSGSFASPRVPSYPDITKYKRRLFHTARLGLPVHRRAIRDFKAHWVG